VAENLRKAGGHSSKSTGIEGDWYLGKGNSNGRLDGRDTVRTFGNAAYINISLITYIS
jgi:hypothetical protein